MRTRRWVFPCVAGCVLAIAGSNAAADAALTPLASCASMSGLKIAPAQIGLPTTGAELTSATLVAAAGQLPEYCKILGAIHPVDPTAPDIQFGVDIPTSWNGKAWQLGGGGNDGTVPNLTVAPPNQSVPGEISQLGQGYATYGSDSGHQGNGTAWELNHEAWINFTYEQLKKTHDAAMQVIKAMYGQTASSNYFSGNSQGGRETLEAITRYPDDYDGASASVPLAYFSNLFVNPPYLGSKQLSPGSWVPATKGPAVAADVLKKCDALDGTADGVVSDYLQCNALVDPTDAPDAFGDLLCPGGADTGNGCLSAAQLPTLNYMYGPIKYNYPLANDESMYPGWGTGLENTGWIWSAVQPVAGDPNYGQGPGATAVRAWMCQCQGGAFSPLSFDPQSSPSQMQTLSNQVDISEDISHWINKGGKLIVLTHASDSISNPRAQMMLYDKWVARFGRDVVNQHVRYYVLPNEPHGTGASDASGVRIPDAVDIQGTISNWVEHATNPPSSLVAQATDNANYTRPMCQYPNYAKYNGTGSTMDATNFTCTDPLSDLSAQTTDSALQARVAAVASNLNNTAAACQAIDQLSAAVMSAATRVPAGVTPAQGKSLVSAISAEQWAVGCLTTRPLDAGQQRLLDFVQTLNAFNLPDGATTRLRANLTQIGTDLSARSSEGQAACNSLDALPIEIGTVAGLSADQATALQSAAKAMQDSLSCPATAVTSTGRAFGTVPATLSLSLNGQPSFGAFAPGLASDYTASTTASVISTAGDATLSISDPSQTATGHLVNGTFALPQALQAQATSAAGTGGAFAPVGGSSNPTALLTYGRPVSNDAVSVTFKQPIASTDALRTGSYSKALTFTLSTTTP